METQQNYEMFRSDTGDFDRNFGEFLMLKQRVNMHVKKCTFFDQRDKKKKWSWCLFEKRFDSQHKDFSHIRMNASREARLE